MLADVEGVLQAGSAWATQARWSSTQRKFLSFCGLVGVKQAAPTGELLMMKFLCWLKRCGHTSWASQRQYVDGVRVLNMSMGHPHPWCKQSYAVDRFEKGMRNLLAKVNGEGKLAIRAVMVRQMVGRCEVSWQGKRFASVCVVLFMLGVRVGHIAPYSNQQHHTQHLICKRHVTCYKRNGVWWGARVVLPSTKTQRYAQDVWVEAVLGEAELCPVACLAWLVQAGDGGPNSPLVERAATVGVSSICVSQK